MNAVSLGLIIAAATLLVGAITVGLMVVYRRRDRREQVLAMQAAADCDRIRHILEQSRKSVGEGNGLYVKDHGAFSGEDRDAFVKLRGNVAFVVDQQLRRILIELVQAYDAAEASAIGFKPGQMAFEIAATHLEPNHPANRVPIIFKKTLERLAVLECRASSLLSYIYGCRAGLTGRTPEPALLTKQ